MVARAEGVGEPGQVVVPLGREFNEIILYHDQQRNCHAGSAH